MRILYVEDRADTALLIQKILRRNEHRVTLANSARQARSLCVDEVFDLWILDLGLPDGHGGDLLRALRRMSDTKAIALTGHAAKHEIQEGKDDGFDAYLVKPINVQLLLDTIDNLAPQPAQQLPHGLADG